MHLGRRTDGPALPRARGGAAGGRSTRPALGYPRSDAGGARDRGRRGGRGGWRDRCGRFRAGGRRIDPVPWRQAALRRPSRAAAAGGDSTARHAAAAGLGGGARRPAAARRAGRAVGGVGDSRCPADGGRARLPLRPHRLRRGPHGGARALPDAARRGGQRHRTAAAHRPRSRPCGARGSRAAGAGHRRAAHWGGGHRRAGDARAARPPRHRQDRCQPAVCRRPSRDALRAWPARAPARAAACPRHDRAADVGRRPSVGVRLRARARRRRPAAGPRRPQRR